MALLHRPDPWMSAVTDPATVAREQGIVHDVG